MTNRDALMEQLRLSVLAMTEEDCAGATSILKGQSLADTLRMAGFAAQRLKRIDPLLLRLQPLIHAASDYKAKHAGKVSASPAGLKVIQAIARVETYLNREAQTASQDELGNA